MNGPSIQQDEDSKICPHRTIRLAFELKSKIIELQCKKRDISIKSTDFKFPFLRVR